MDNKYDVVIIGAGIGGLVCGCYLAKAGMKVLVVEKHSKAGGYCTSFQKDGYKFDVGVHSLGGIRKRFLGQILNELDLKNEIEFNQFDPIDKIITLNNITYIRTDYCETLKGLKKNFPTEKQNIERFFAFFKQNNFFNIYKKIRKLTFKQLLDEFFDNGELKIALGILMFNFGLSWGEASALLAVFFYRDYIFDGGYYPKGGMQSFSDSFVEKMKMYGGNLLLQKKVIKIKFYNKKIEGIELDDGNIVRTKCIVSNIDATQTFKELAKEYDSKEKTLVDKLHISRSLLALYMGTEVSLKRITTETCNMWSLISYKIGRYFSDFEKNIKTSNFPFVMINFPSAHVANNIKKNTLQAFTIVPFISENFWKQYKDELVTNLFRRVEMVLPKLKQNVKLKAVATPLTLYKYTLNKNGAGFGWMSTVGQIKSSFFPQKTSVEGLFLTGHWCSIGSGQGGIPKVIISARKAANLVMKYFGIKWEYD